MQSLDEGLFGQSFVRNPKGIDSLLSSVERQKKTIFASS